MFDFRHLDTRTRTHMMGEFERDCDAANLYFSTRFTDEGRERYPGLMRKAIMDGSEATLSAAFRGTDCFARTEYRRGKPVSVPHTAAVTFAEGEFNRFYARGVCLRAFEDGSNEVEVYRAKSVVNARPASVALIGTRLPATTLLDDLRLNVGVDPALGLPPGPNSGLSVFCGCRGC